jgi:ABC-type ATPase involved in cell division
VSYLARVFVELSACAFCAFVPLRRLSDDEICLPSLCLHSTIIKLITDELKPPEGEVRRNQRLRVGVYNQHFVERLPMDEDPVTYLRRLFNEETYQSVRNKLGKYGLEGHAHTLPIRDLSGGQKARVVFVELSFMAPHLLFLDEPTNNLGEGFFFACQLGRHGSCSLRGIFDKLQNYDLHAHFSGTYC